MSGTGSGQSHNVETCTARIVAGATPGTGIPRHPIRTRKAPDFVLNRLDVTYTSSRSFQNTFGPGPATSLLCLLRLGTLYIASSSVHAGGWELKP